MLCNISLCWNTLHSQAASWPSEHHYLLLVHLKSSVQFVYPGKNMVFGEFTLTLNKVLTGN